MSHEYELGSDLGLRIGLHLHAKGQLAQRLVVAIIMVKRSSKLLNVNSLENESTLSAFMGE